MADAVDSKSTAGNGVGVQVPSRAKTEHQKTLEIQCFQGSFFAQNHVFIPFGDNLGIITAKIYIYIELRPTIKSIELI